MNAADSRAHPLSFCHTAVPVTRPDLHKIHKDIWKWKRNIFLWNFFDCSEYFRCYYLFIYVDRYIRQLPKISHMIQIFVNNKQES